MGFDLGGNEGGKAGAKHSEGAQGKDGSLETERGGVVQLEEAADEDAQEFDLGGEAVLGQVAEGAPFEAGEMAEVEGGNEVSHREPSLRRKASQKAW
jgi:hypothetical protein